MIGYLQLSKEQKMKINIPLKMLKVYQQKAASTFLSIRSYIVITYMIPGILHFYWEFCILLVSVGNN